MDVPIEMIFEYPTIEQLAEKLYSNTLTEAAERRYQQTEPAERPQPILFSAYLRFRDFL